MPAFHRHHRVLYAITCLLGCALCPLSALSQQQSITDQFGVITVGKPKIWRYERVYSTLDGLLRDVNSITVTTLSNMDANSPNSASIDFIQQTLNGAVSFDGVTGTQNSALLSKIQGAAAYDKQRSVAANTYLTGLEGSRATLAAQYSALSAQLTGTTDATAAAALKSQMTDISTQITSINTLITSGSPPATGQQLSTTDIGALKSTAPQAPSGGSTLASPFDVKSLSDKLLDPSKATLPASKQIDNFVALLHERLLHQLSVIYDDHARDNSDIYLVEFDVGLFPSKHAKHRVARVQFSVSAADNPNLCTASSDSGVHAYELYPDTASYNISTFYGKSNHTGIRGAASFLMGFGGTLEYQRQRDSLRSSLNQSIYVSGFGAGTCQFGWYYAPSPFEDRVAPTSRSAYVLLIVPKKANAPGSASSQTALSIKPHVAWVSQDQPVPKVDTELTWTSIDLPAADTSQIALESVEYSPIRSSPRAPNAQGPDAASPNVTMNLSFVQPIDPNMVITVNGLIIKRVRDTRGQGTTIAKSAGSAGQAGTNGATAFGLLESDTAGPDTWIAMGSRSLQLTLSKATVGEDRFPVIGITDSGHVVASFTTIAAKAQQLTIDGRRFTSEGNSSISTGSIWVPLFLSPMQPTKSIVVDVPKKLSSGLPSALRITLTQSTPASGMPPGFGDSAQVVISPEGSLEKNFALPCRADADGALDCDVSETTSKLLGSLPWKISIQQPAYVGDKASYTGIYGDALLSINPTVQTRVSAAWDIASDLNVDGSLKGWTLNMRVPSLQFPIQLLFPRDPDAITIVDCTNGYVVCDSGVPTKISMYVKKEERYAVVDEPIVLLSGLTKQQISLPSERAPLELGPFLVSKSTGSFQMMTGSNASAIDSVVYRGCSEQAIPVRHSRDAIFFEDPHVSADQPCPLAILSGGRTIDVMDPTGKAVVLLVTKASPAGHEANIATNPNTSAQNPPRPAGVQDSPTIQASPVASSSSSNVNQPTPLPTTKPSPATLKSNPSSVDLGKDLPKQTKPQ